MKPIRLSLALFFFLAIAFGMVWYVVLVLTETHSLPASSKETVHSESSDNADKTFFDPPVAGSVPADFVQHAVPLEEIKKGCFLQDCIPSVDQPVFVPASVLTDVLSSSSLGVYVPEADRFYPFPMLETREIVNDILPNGKPVAVTYCPLCGTGIVFSREIDNGIVREFGVSGMLWQSNLLMYDRAESLAEQSLWSQVLGKAVVGPRADQDLQIVPSDVITFADWLAKSESGETLNTGTVAAPYGDDYFAVANTFEPNFSEAESPIPAMTRVHGIVVDGVAKAYISDELFTDFTDVVGETRLFVSIQGNSISFVSSNAEEGLAPTVIPDVEGFWFSWAAAHPDTLLWVGD